MSLIRSISLFVQTLLITAAGILCCYLVIVYVHEKNFDAATTFVAILIFLQNMKPIPKK